MPEILDTAQIELQKCAEKLEGGQVSPYTCAYVGRDAEAAVRFLQMEMVNAAPGLKSRTDEVAEEINEHVGHLVSEGPLNSTEAYPEDIEKLRRLVDEARELAMELRDDDFGIDEIRNRKTMNERFEEIGRAAYDHPDLMEEPLEELFRRESDLMPPLGRVKE